MGRKEPRITNLDWYSHGNNVPDFEHFIDRALQNDTETQVLNYLRLLIWTCRMQLAGKVGNLFLNFVRKQVRKSRLMVDELNIRTKPLQISFRLED